MLEDVDFLFAELTGRKRFHTEKLEKVDIDTILSFQFGVGRFVKIGGRVLGNQDIFNLQCAKALITFISGNPYLSKHCKQFQDDEIG